MTRKARWTLAELNQEVRHALSVGYVPATSARVKAVPDRRTIRYYTTLGLIDRPAEMRGRTAYYGERHLLQLVAIKRLQGEGLTLARVQESLTGLTDAKLRKIARLPDRAQPEPAAAAEAVAEPAPRARAAFWEAEPAELPVADTPVRTVAPAQRELFAPEPFTGVELGAGVKLLLPTDRELDPIDLSDLQKAAAPLMTYLTRLGIIDSRE